jgi:hypothetical protein
MWIPSGFAVKAVFASSHEPKPNRNGLSQAQMAGAGLLSGWATAGAAAGKSRTLSRHKRKQRFVHRYIVFSQFVGANRRLFSARQYGHIAPY